MAEYKHGAYGMIQATGTLESTAAANAFVYIGTAPVNQVVGGSENVNKPVLVRNIAEAKRLFGYSDEWGDFTLCEAMHAHLELGGVGPLVLINVLDPTAHVKEQTSKSLTPQNGRVTIAGAERIVLDSLTITGKQPGEDYTAAYNTEKGTIVIAEAKDGSLGTQALNISFKEVDTSKVTESTVIGSTDGYGLNTGLYCVRNVYQQTGFIPSFLLAPGFSGIPKVHEAMGKLSQKINEHWDAYMLTDIPIADKTKGITLAAAAEWKENNGYTLENETVYFPMASGTDGRKYHISVLAAANLQKLISQQDGVPYRTASSTDCAIIQNLYMGEEGKGRIFDDTLINEALNANGIASAAFVGGRWCIWGAHSADYSKENGNTVNISEVNRMMLYYISNDFQHRRPKDVDQHMTANGIQSIVAEEQARLDALRAMGAILHGEVALNVNGVDGSDLVNGDFTFSFQVTVMPLCKSLTALVGWTDKGFETYYESLEDL